ncbi:MAG: methyltransferase domain-containing protein [Candidatus Nealsonbacteria bacterium]|nr:methyltransferase domain-containing protein [Candidatus Nealsonbacteria bacterium]
MDEKYAEYLLVEGRKGYDVISKEFSDSRAFLWEELIPLARYIEPGDKVLDLGCGNGRLFGLLREKNINYAGVDSSEELIKIAKEKYPEEASRFSIAEALNLSFPDNSFDKIYCIAVLHHIPSDNFRLKFLEEAKRVLKNKGLLILTVWNLWSKKETFWFLLKYTILRFFGKSKLDQKDILYLWKGSQEKKRAERYFHCFDKKELEGLAKKSGFHVRDSGFFSRGKNKKANIYLVVEK